MELINGVPRNKDGLIFELLAKYPPYCKSSEREKWPRVDGRLSGRFNANDLTSSFTGTNRTVIDANGLQITLPASVPAIDHIGNALTPALRLEPAAANILLGAPPVTQDLTLGLGSFTLQVFGAGTAAAAGNTATITGAGTASNGTPVTFVVTVAGTVTITITTATVVWLCPGAIPSSYFAGAAAIGAELVTDGGFDAVTEGADLLSGFDFTAGWTTVNNATIVDADTFTSNDAVTANGVRSPDILTVGKCYHLELTGTTTAGVFKVDQGSGVPITTDTDPLAIDVYFNATVTNFLLRLQTVIATVDITTLTIKPVTFTSWTAGTGWAPQATVGALTGKAQKIAGTASALSQTGTAATAGKVYRLSHVATRTAGTCTPEFGSTNGAAVSASGTYYDYPIAADTDFPKFNADATFAGTIDSVSVKEHGTVRLSEANTTTLAIPAAVAAMLAAGTGTIVIKGRFAFARAAGVVTNILASAAATNSLVYTTTASGNITSNDGTTIAENTGAYTANTDWKIALKFPSDTDKYRIGIDVAGAGIVWGTEVAFDGAFTATANLILGYVLHGATWIKYIKVYNKVLTDAQINAQ